MVSDEALKKLQEQIAAWPMERRFVVQQLIEDYRRNREDLRAYKDTGFEPEKVTALGRLFDYALEESKTLTEQLALLNRIRELAEADKDGRVVVLPCKVGDTVYLIVTKRAKVYMPEFSFVKKSRLTSFNMERVLQDFGKAVFLTREEAEAALSAREG